MNVLVIGGGAREHAIAWKLRQSPRVEKLFVAPGNAGTASLGTNLPIWATDIPSLLKAARDHAIDLTMVGPEAPLAEGIVDRFQERGLPVFGPSQAAARIEASKAFAKEVMQRSGIPCARGEVFDSYPEARRFIERRGAPLVVKADGLAAGKGVTVAATEAEAMAALDACMVERVFGPAGERVVIEERLEGREVSVFAFTDGQRLSPLVAACDYKRAYDGDHGPNTGGMGSYAPPELWSPSLARDVEYAILRPTIQALAREGCPYRGVLYAGLMLTAEGPKVLEFNCRLGDPEAQVVLPLLEADLVEVAQAVLAGDVSQAGVRWSQKACVGVVLASEGYPGSYQRGFPIHGLEAAGPDALVFHAGTRLSNGSVVSDGGRVLTIVGRGTDLAAARQLAYRAVEGVRFQGAFHRGDIALLPSRVADPGA
ncbi:MAG: phosphoribosylamine--glycine ligase [Chloroflexi bacterium]|nr:phosphoribosylamine--glycine ligase [Chloroflexota bacterium]